MASISLRPTYHALKEGMTARYVGIRLKHISMSVILCFSFSLLLTFVSANLQDRFQNRRIGIGSQLAYLHGDLAWFQKNNVPYIPEFQNRILFPALLETAAHLHLFTLTDWYLLVRLASALFATTAFWYLLTQKAGATPKLAAMGIGMLVYATIFTFNHSTELPSDFFDMLFTTLFVWSVLSYRKLALLCLVLVASANRDSAVFAGLMWLIVWGRNDSNRVRWTDAVFGLTMSAVSYGWIWMIRYGLGGAAGVSRQMLGGAQLWERLIKVIVDPNPFAWPFLLFAMVAPLLLWIASNWRFINHQSKQLLTAVIVITVITFVFGIAEELRIFLPSLVLLIFVAVRGEGQSQRSREHTYTHMFAEK